MWGRETDHMRAVVKVTGTQGPDFVSKILSAAYQASREGTILLVLNGLSSRSADQCLDPAVRRLGTEVEGIRYLPFERLDEEALELIAIADFAIAESPELKSLLVLHRIPFISMNPGIQRLTGVSETTEARTMRTNSRPQDHPRSRHPIGSVLTTNSSR
jgi:hypothetical protein